ncbi:MAG TPA: tetratricopeptide repeat protein [Pyrinomonadaceae bacterium]|nr:tetratricopeptide repeat protein [Pyrinomonadaceae bacterium]
MNSSNSNYSHASRYLRLGAVAIAIGCCLFAMRVAVAHGVSQLLGTYSLKTGSAAAAKKAIQISPKDADAHVASAGTLSLAHAPEQSLVELEQAIALRPSDYRLWSELGLVRDQVGDTAGALLAYDEAIARAPHYSQPRWNRGNVLLRSKEYEAGFKDLSQAAQSNPELIPGLLDLAWGLSRGDVAFTEQLVGLRGDKMRIAFAELLVRQGRPQEAVAQFVQATDVSDGVKTQLIDKLSAKGAFKQAFDIWKTSHGFRAETEQAGPSIYDGGFEGTLSFGERGFGWRVPRDLPATSISLDSSRPHTGSKSLRIDLNGIANAGWLSQLVLLEPSRRYRINFASRSQDIVTGGLPFLVVTDASAAGKQLGQSPPLAKGTTDWHVYSIEFTTAEKTSAIQLSVQRENCTTSPCPIFGSISLDSFSVEQLQ